MDNLNNKKEPFYSKFINEDILKNIEDEDIQNKFSYYHYSITVLTGCSCFLPFFVGFNMENLVCIIFNIGDFICYFFLAYFSIKFLILVNKYKVYKNIIHAYLFVIINILLSVTFSLVAYFTTEVTVESFYLMSAKFNLGLFILIFLPLEISYMIYTYYSSLKCFVKYSKMYKKIHNNENN